MREANPTVFVSRMCKEFVAAKSQLVHLQDLHSHRIARSEVDPIFAVSIRTLRVTVMIPDPPNGIPPNRHDRCLPSPAFLLGLQIDSSP